jgi:hypothetical protein
MVHKEKNTFSSNPVGSQGQRSWGARWKTNDKGTLIFLMQYCLVQYLCIMGSFNWTNNQKTFTRLP